MAIEAPLCRYKKTNFKITIIILLVATVWFAYDGYANDKFIEKHTNADGSVDATLVFHRKSPPFFAAGAIALAIYFWIIKGKKLVADEEALVFSNGNKITYNSIESVDKTNYQSKGYFVIRYKDAGGTELRHKISNRTYDNLDAILEHLIAKITA